MKKLLMALAMTATMAMASVCAAAGEGAALTKEQKAAEALFNGLNGVETATYAQASAGMVPELKTKITEEAFNNLKKSVKDKLGNCKEANFRSFERFNDGDRVVYMGKYSKEEAVAMVFVFNPAGKIVNFALNPLQKAPAQPAAPAKK